MKRRLELSDKVAVITGGGGGIGRAVARSLAARGCHVALADISEEGMAQTARLIGDVVNVSCHRLDVADVEAITAFPEIVIKAHGSVDVVINNAGVALGGDFEDLTADEFDWLLHINLQSVLRMSRAFLPILRARPIAQLVNISSIYGILAPPGHTAYVTSKFAVRGFSESLRHELERSGSTVGVTVVHPGGVRTAIADTARLGAAISADDGAARRERNNKTLRMSPEQAGEIIVKGIARRKPRVLVGSDARLGAIVERVLPVSYYAVLKGKL